MLKESKILVVDDEPANVLLLERILESANYTRVVSTTDSRRAADLFDEFQPDLVLSDLLMPHLDGFALIQQLRARGETARHVPIVILTADVTCEAKRQALSLGASDFLTKPFDHSEVLLRARNLLEIRSLQTQLQSQNAVLEDKVRQRTQELEDAMKQLAAAQQKMVQQECLRALGVMAGGIVHDFNNSLAAILGYSDLLLNERPDAFVGKPRDYLQIIITAASDAASMVTRLREFSRPREEKDPHQSIQLNPLIQQTVAMTLPKWKSLARSAGRTIHIEVEAGDIPAVSGDPAELREMLTNLIFNAVDALPEGGTITIRTFQLEGRVALQVRDTGIGMPEDVRQRCFDPFFSTKGEHGTGLGLAMVYGIVQRHQGSIEIESAAEQGTTISIALPVIEVTPDTPAPPSRMDMAAPLTRALRILAVDDEPLLCQLLVHYLSIDGHQVQTAANGCEALSKFHENTFDLVITDKAMPEMDGGQLYSAIKRLKPSQPVILLTGFGDSPNAAHDGSAAADVVLSKPFSLETLRAGVAETIGHNDRALVSSPC